MRTTAPIIGSVLFAVSCRPPIPAVLHLLSQLHHGLAGPPPAQEGESAASGAQRHPSGVQQFADRVGRLAGKQFDVVHADPARFIQFLGQVGAEPGGDREPLPDRTTRGHYGQAMSCEYPLHVRVSVQGGNELDLGWPVGGVGPPRRTGSPWQWWPSSPSPPNSRRSR